MAQLTPAERRKLASLSELTHCNPFEPRRIELEQQVLGDPFVEENVNAWSRTEATDRQERPNIVRINEWASGVLEVLRKRQLAKGVLEGNDVALYDDLATYHLYYQHLAPIGRNLLAFTGDSERLAKLWRAFRKERRHLLEPLGAAADALASDAHLFAGLHQIRRAFTNIFDFLIGESEPATRLRASVWQSLFTHDLRRYRRTLYSRMNEFATLITGPSGSGKELIAQAIGRSQYVPFDPEREKFHVTTGAAEPFIAVNLAALSPTLIESELFGHRQGAFTGAIADRIGWFERCPASGAVFLDEIGELDPALQVKLLRVAQSRDYSRLGESTPRRFGGKLLAATNRDLAAEMRAGRFREDLYYRLCSDCVQAPALREQLADRPAALAGLVRYLRARCWATRSPMTTKWSRWPRRWKRGSPRACRPITRGPVTSANWSSACGACWCAANTSPRAPQRQQLRGLYGSPPPNGASFRRPAPERLLPVGVCSNRQLRRRRPHAGARPPDGEKPCGAARVTFAVAWTRRHRFLCLLRARCGGRSLPSKLFQSLQNSARTS